MTALSRARASGVSLLVWSASVAVRAQMATADRVREPGFWPTKGEAVRAEYAGAAVCADCHTRHAETQPSTRMARTAMRVEDSEVLRARPLLQFRSGAYTYEIAKGSYSASDGARSSTAPLRWAFGDGRVGQTYLFERDGALHEARVSYYDSVHALGFTPARAIARPRDLAEALSRPLDEAEARRCFGCHTTASTVQGRFEPSGLSPGVTCEACHGPGRAHVAAIETGRLTAARAAILNPAGLSPADRVDFCGACHATFWDVKLAGEKGVAALRSQPHRLQSSRCWGEGDARITCTACHDPHRPLVREAAAYDPKCLACHVAAGARPTRERPGRSCPVGKDDCVSCHMPKYEVAEMHSSFTDHLIR
ncbi:MAG TPA: multiheme c-type cytochrome [Vicinamibacteria bacterium]|jgi:cytochrome c553